MVRARGASGALVVVGQGYVGLPLALRASEAGFDVIGLDANESVVAALNAGSSHIDDVDDTELAAALARGYRAITDAARIAEADVVVVCVPTPLTSDGGPDLGALLAAADEIGSYVRPGTLCVLESTSYPGTTEEHFLPLVTRRGLVPGRDVFVAYSPERIDPGNSAFGLANTPKVVGGVTESCALAARAFYEQLVDEVVLAKGTKEAELAKVLENTFRSVNIALVNEMVRFCHDLDIDLWNAIDCAATKPFGFMPFRPGPGVGGHCIPVDPRYLGHRVQEKLGYPFSLLQAAERINGRAPGYVAKRVISLLTDAGTDVAGASVLLLGVTYKPNIADCRESPAEAVVSELAAQGVRVSYHDPHVAAWTPRAKGVADELLSVGDPYSAAQCADVTVLLQNHLEYDLTKLADVGGTVLDTRGVMTGPNVERL